MNERLEEHTHVAVKIDEYKKLKEQAERVQELEEHLRMANQYVKKEREVNTNLRKQNKRNRESLEFYAEEGNHDFEIDVTTSHLDVNSPILKDRGEKARQALEGEE